MKKYLTIAAVLGVIAFASVSFLAHADEQSAPAAAKLASATQLAADASDGEAAADKAAASDAPPADKFSKDDQECAASSGQTAPDATPNDPKADAAYKKCMKDKGYADPEAGDGTHDQGEHPEE